MLSDGKEDPAEDPGLGEELYERVLGEAREVSEKTLERLRGLGEHLPDGVIEQLERLHEDPLHERRKAARVGDGSIPVAIWAEQLPDEAGAAVMDHCPTGVAVLLPCPAGVGTILRIRIPSELGGDGWVTVEVKHCRKEGGGWLAGCELLGNQPPI